MAFRCHEKLAAARALISRLDRAELRSLEHDRLFDACFELLTAIRDLRRRLTIAASEASSEGSR